MTRMPARSCSIIGHPVSRNVPAASVLRVLLSCQKEQSKKSKRVVVDPESRESSKRAHSAYLKTIHGLYSMSGIRRNDWSGLQSFWDSEIFFSVS